MSDRSWPTCASVFTTHASAVRTNTLREKGAQQDFSFIHQQNGMFSFSGLTKEQVLRLREEFGVYAGHQAG
ncbi:hypothetical protein M8494_16170 [Serratia ureilytica]